MQSLAISALKEPKRAEIQQKEFAHLPDLLILVFFGGVKSQGKPPKKQGLCLSVEPLKTPGKGGENAQDTEHDRAKVPPHNGSDPTSPLQSKAPLLPDLLEQT